MHQAMDLILEWTRLRLITKGQQDSLVAVRKEGKGPHKQP